MNETSTIIEKVLPELSKGILSSDQIRLVLNNPINFPSVLIEKLSLATALNYWNKQISYIDADCIMNNLYTFWVANDNFIQNSVFPEIAWECYLAFDAGEFYPSNEDKTIDPSEKYTRPLVDSLLKKQSLIP